VLAAVEGEAHALAALTAAAEQRCEVSAELRTLLDSAAKQPQLKQCTSALLTAPPLGVTLWDNTDVDRDSSLEATQARAAHMAAAADSMLQEAEQARERCQQLQILLQASKQVSLR
jgi:hypothetical protein